jgi:hypothetical protein
MWNWRDGIIAVVATAAGVLAFWPLWRFMVLKHPESPAKCVVVAFGLLLFACAPATFVLEAIGSGQVTHYIRGPGPNPTYAMSEDPARYWTTVSAWYAAFVFLLVGFFYMLRGAMQRRPEMPNNAMQATRETRAPDS